MRDIESTIESPFVLGWRPFNVEISGLREEVRLRFDDTDPPEFHRVTAVQISGTAVVEVDQVSLGRMRLGDLNVAYGDVRLGRASGILVASDASGDTKLTIQLRPDEHGATERLAADSRTAESSLAKPLDPQ